MFKIVFTAVVLMVGGTLFGLGVMFSLKTDNTMTTADSLHVSNCYRGYVIDPTTGSQIKDESHRYIPCSN